MMMFNRQARLEALREALRKHATRGRRGMTLMEVMIVIAIILMLMGVLAFGLGSMFAEAQADTARLQISRIAERVKIYQVKKRKVPTTGEGLKAVFPNEDLPTDPWGNSYVYVAPGPNGRAFDIISYGADGKEGGTGSDADIKLSEMEM